MTLFERMTDSQLHDYIMETLNKALNVVGTNSQRISEMDRLNSQADRCKKYLEFRKQNRANIDEYVKQWKEQLEDRRSNAILNLPTACTYNGQLIAALLEDHLNGGLKGEELKSLCDEYIQINDSDFLDLLDKLGNENIIGVNEDNYYYLRNICTKSLFPLKMLDNGGTVSSVIRRGIVDIIANEGKPIPYYKLLELCLSYNWNSVKSKTFLADSNKTTYWIENEFDELIDMGIIKEQAEIMNEKLYFFKMLGEETVNEM